MLFKDETEKILKACINVHNELGNCFLEPVYQEALAIEFDLLGIPYEKEVKLEISYKGHKLDKIYYADFVCFDYFDCFARAAFAELAAARERYCPDFRAYAFYDGGVCPRRCRFVSRDFSFLLP